MDWLRITYRKEQTVVTYAANVFGARFLTLDSVDDCLLGVFAASDLELFETGGGGVHVFWRWPANKT